MLNLSGVKGTCWFVGEKTIFKPKIDPWMKIKYQNFIPNRQDTSIQFVRDDFAFVKL